MTVNPGFSGIIYKPLFGTGFASGAWRDDLSAGHSCGRVAFRPRPSPIAGLIRDCSIPITRDCFESGFALLSLASPAIRLDGLADGADDADFAGDRFFADFDIEILRSVDDGLAPHHRSPTSAIKPAGQDLRAPLGARNFR